MIRLNHYYHFIDRKRLDKACVVSLKKRNKKISVVRELYLIRLMIFKLIGIAIIGVITVTLLKSAKPEFAVFATIATGVVMIITMLSALRDVVLAFDNIVEKSGINDEVFSAVLKIIGIGYLTEYSASVATDAGCASIAQKLQFGGKIVIFLMSISIVSSLVDLVSSLVSAI